MEIYHEIVSTVIFLLPLIREGLLSVTSEPMCTDYWLTAWSKLAQEKGVFRLTDYLDMTIAVYLDGRSQTKQKKRGKISDTYILNLFTVQCPGSAEIILRNFCLKKKSQSSGILENSVYINHIELQKYSTTKNIFRRVNPTQRNNVVQ